MIASGPACPDCSTAGEALEIVNDTPCGSHPRRLPACAARRERAAKRPKHRHRQRPPTGGCRGADVQALGLRRGNFDRLPAERGPGCRALAGAGGPGKIRPPGAAGRRRDRRACDGARPGWAQPGACPVRGGADRGQRALAVSSFGFRWNRRPTDAAGGYVDGQTQAAWRGRGSRFPMCWPRTTRTTRWRPAAV